MEFDLVDLNQQDDSAITSTIIKEKEAKIKELQTNLDRYKCVIKFHEQENQKLKTKHVIDEVKLIKAQREAEKAKFFLEETLETYGETNEAEDKVPRIRPRTGGMKRALEIERKKEPEIINEITWNEKFSIVINENLENQFESINEHLEKLLEKEKKDNDIQRNMAKHYCRRNQIARSMLKKVNSKLDNLIMQEEKRKLENLTEASLHAQPTSSEKILQILVHSY